MLTVSECLLVIVDVSDDLEVCLASNRDYPIATGWCRMVISFALLMQFLSIYVDILTTRNDFLPCDQVGVKLQVHSSYMYRQSQRRETRLTALSYRLCTAILRARPMAMLCMLINHFFRRLRSCASKQEQAGRWHYCTKCAALSSATWACGTR